MPGNLNPARTTFPKFWGFLCFDVFSTESWFTWIEMPLFYKKLCHARYNPEEMKVRFHVEICVFLCSRDQSSNITQGDMPFCGWAVPDLLCCWSCVCSLVCAKTSPLLIVCVSDPKQRILEYLVHVTHLLSFQQDEAVLSDGVYSWPCNENSHHQMTVNMKSIVTDLRKPPVGTASEEWGWQSTAC